MFPNQNPVQNSPLSHTRYMPRPSHSSRFYHPLNVGRGVENIKLLIMYEGWNFNSGNYLFTTDTK